MRYLGHRDKRSHDQDNSPPVIAAVDLGTNSCRLLVGCIIEDDLKIIDSFSRVVRLGEGLEETGLLSEKAMERTLEALSLCQKKIRSNDVIRLRSVTTEACRRASNSAQFLERIRQEIDLDIEIISNAEEARLALSGCSGVLTSKTSYALAFDIGGGSTEIMWLKHDPENISQRMSRPMPEVIDWISLPFGVVTLSEIYGVHLSSEKTYDEIRRRVRERLYDFSERNKILDYIGKDQVQMVGTSGTVTTIGALSLELPHYDRQAVDELFLRIPEARKICRKLLTMDEIQRLNHSCIGVGRSDLVIVGAAIFEGICDVWDLETLRIADRGVREGILHDLARDLRP